MSEQLVVLTAFIKLSYSVITNSSLLINFYTFRFKLYRFLYRLFDIFRIFLNNMHYHHYDYYSIRCFNIFFMIEYIF